jgi:5-methylcytosine-specific restriction endonuclease McrA
MKAWQAANPRDRSAYKAAYDAEHWAEQAEYRAKNAERLRAQKAGYYQANREKRLVYVKAYTEAHKPEVLAYHASHYEANADRIKAAVRAYQRANPEKKAVLESRRRARKAGNGGSHTVAQRREKFALFGNACAYCGRQGDLTEDHVVPLSRGGTDDISNIVPACRSCNSRKGARTNHEKIGGVGSKQSDSSRYEGR